MAISNSATALVRLVLVVLRKVFGYGKDARLTVELDSVCGVSGQLNLAGLGSQMSDYVANWAAPL